MGPIELTDRKPHRKSRSALLIVVLITLLGISHLYFSGLAAPLFAQAATTDMLSTPLATFTKLAAGHDHSCALTTDGTLQCWGDNADGQVGDGSDFPSRPPSAVTGLTSGVTDVATGGNHSCALLTDGVMKCWGRNSDGQLGDGSTDERLLPVDVLGLPAAAVTALAAGEGHTCVLLQGGTAACWGRNNRGQLGDGSNEEKRSPAMVSGLTGSVVEIVAGFGHTCARLTDGSIHCWGDNSRGQLGNGTQTNSNTPVTVSGLSRPAIALTAGFYHTCAALQDGDVECWGRNDRGQLGDSTRDDQNMPTAVQDLSDDIAHLAAGRYHTCALAIDGDLHCWGSSSRGQLGTGSLESSRTPVRISTLGDDAVAIVAGEEHSCAILDSNVVRCWGSNRDRQLGEGSPGLHSVPQLLFPNRASGPSMPVNSPLKGIPQIALGRYHTCLITATRGVQCWGRNSDGQVGDGSTERGSTPVNVVGLDSGVVGLALGAEHSCALRQTGTVACWGSNQYGQLGDGTTDKRATPIEVNGLLGNVATISAGDNHTCVLMQGGDAKCWGQNSAGQLGDGTTADSGFPTNVSGLSGATALAAGTVHSCALTRGNVQCWGGNDSGQLGDGTRISRNSPDAVTGLPAGSATALATGDRHTCAAVDGMVYCWGNNRDGQLGNGAEDDQVMPVAVPDLPGNIRQLGAGASHNCGLTENNGVVCWGGNEQSQLGDGSTADRAVVAPVDGLAANTLSLQSGGYHNCVLVTGNRPLCWGSDSDGQLASGIVAQSTLPSALGTAPPPRIDTNTIGALVGSAFTLIGSGFGISDTVPIVVNGTLLTETLQVNPSGEFIVYVESGTAESGTYELTFGHTPAIQQLLFLQLTGDLQRAEGGGRTIVLPEGIGRELTTLYMPIVAR